MRILGRRAGGSQPPRPHSVSQFLGYPGTVPGLHRRGRPHHGCQLFAGWGQVDKGRHRLGDLLRPTPVVNLQVHRRGVPPFVLEVAGPKQALLQFCRRLAGNRIAASESLHCRHSYESLHDEDVSPRVCRGQCKHKVHGVPKAVDALGHTFRHSKCHRSGQLEAKVIDGEPVLIGIT